MEFFGDFAASVGLATGLATGLVARLALRFALALPGSNCRLMLPAVSRLTSRVGADSSSSEILTTCSSGRTSSSVSLSPSNASRPCARGSVTFTPVASTTPLNLTLGRATCSKASLISAFSTAPTRRNGRLAGT